MGLGTFIDGVYESGEHEYPEEDVRGQAALCEAMIDWLDDDTAGHPLNIDAALSDFEVILALYTSALNHQVIELPFEPGPALVHQLRRALAEGN